ncbi:hypothetical protein C8R46DRAFT_1036408 [Mycena filopes]|nr:hypothetical protein C8R46DRAFT_1036408 [Mycena filopes]
MRTPTQPQKSHTKFEVYRRSGAFWQEQRRLKEARLQAERQRRHAAQGQIWVLPAPQRGQPSAAVPPKRRGPSQADIATARANALILERLAASKKLRQEKERVAQKQRDERAQVAVQSAAKKNFSQVLIGILSSRVRWA